MSWRYNRFPKYISVAERKLQAAKEALKLKKRGKECDPIVIEGRTIAQTFWSKAWCKHLESYSDFENRLPRGRSYVRNGSVIDLKVSSGEINALVSGSSIYNVKITIKKVIEKQWKTLVEACSGKIDSLIELLQGKFSKSVMEVMTHSQNGLFPQPKEITLNCSCPDWADMCKHVAAVLYGIGARFDKKPEELFLLRQADHLELISKASAVSLTKTSKDKDIQVIEDSELSALFGIDLGEVPEKKKKNIKSTSIPEPKPKSEPLKKMSKKKTVVKAVTAKTTKPIKKKTVVKVVVKKPTTKKAVPLKKKATAKKPK